MLNTVSNENFDLPADWPRSLREISTEGSVPCWIARAPGRLDVMGGITDYTGGLIAGLMLERGVWAAAQSRSDGRFVFHCERDAGSGETRRLEFSIGDLFRGSVVVPAADFAARIDELGGSWCLPVAGLFHALACRGQFREGQPGCALNIRTELSAGPGEIQVAALQAIGAVLEMESNPADVREICHHASRIVGGLPSGELDPLTVLLGRKEVLICMNLESADSPRFVPVPESIRFVGIETGARHRLAKQKRRKARTESAMGARVIDALRGSAGRDTGSIGLQLSSVSTAEYVRSYRDRIPARIKGDLFAQRFGCDVADADPPEPDVWYKVRSRVEHHIYDNERCREFVSLMRRAGESPNADWLTDAGQLMNCSHWSYGQRCALSTIQTDFLVRILVERGFGQGIFGARISGAGGGGTVAVMAARGRRADDAIASAMDEYRQHTGLEPQLYEVGGCSAQRFGVRQIQTVGA